MNREIPNHVSLIDSDPRKKNYFDSLAEVRLPQEASKEIKESEVIIICTDIHANDILSDIKNKFNKTYNKNDIYIIDML